MVPMSSEDSGSGKQLGNGTVDVTDYPNGGADQPDHHHHYHDHEKRWIIERGCMILLV